VHQKGGDTARGSKTRSRPTRWVASICTIVNGPRARQQSRRTSPLSSAMAPASSQLLTSNSTTDKIPTPQHSFPSQSLLTPISPHPSPHHSLHPQNPLTPISPHHSLPSDHIAHIHQRFALIPISYHRPTSQFPTRHYAIKDFHSLSSDHILQRFASIPVSHHRPPSRLSTRQCPIECFYIHSDFQVCLLRAMGNASKR